jgi:uncharacterized protein (TIGR00290 family)
MKPAIFNWSGGKDSAMALYEILQASKYDVKYLMTSVSDDNDRISMHGVRKSLLEQQCTNMGLPLRILQLPKSPEMDVYEKELFQIMNGFKDEGIKHSIFGDIFLEDLRIYREKQLEKVKMKGVFPLWKKDTAYLIEQFIDLGFKTILTAVDESKLDKSFAGRVIDKDFIKDLPKTVDPCGENGEFHTFVYDGPIFQKSVDFTKGDIVHKTYSHEKTYGFWFCDLLDV